jgi:hypothetical protein
MATDDPMIAPDAPLVPAPSPAADRAASPWLPAIAAGLVAAVLSALLGELLLNFFPAATSTASINGQPTQQVTPEAKAEADRKNSPLTFGLMGAVLATALAVAGALAARRPSALPTALLMGVAVAAAGAAAGSWLLAHRFLDYQHWAEDRQQENMLVPLLLHVGMWCLAGAGGGLAFGYGLAGKRGASAGLIGGLAGAVLGAAVYEVLGALLFPTAKTSQPFAEEAIPRIMAVSLVCLFTAIVAAFAIADSARKRPAA